MILIDYNAQDVRQHVLVLASTFGVAIAQIMVKCSLCTMCGLPVSDTSGCHEWIHDFSDVEVTGEA